MEQNIVTFHGKAFSTLQNILTTERT